MAKLPAAVVGLISFPSDSFTRPADTTAYASADLVANSTTNTLVKPLKWRVSRAKGLTAFIRRARLSKSTGTQTITLSSFRLHLYSTNPCTPNAPTNGDNGAWLTAQAGYLGSMDITVDKLFTPSASSSGQGIPAVGTEIPTYTEFVFGLLEARAAYTPLSAEVFECTLEVWQN